MHRIYGFLGAHVWKIPSLKERSSMSTTGGLGTKSSLEKSREWSSSPICWCRMILSSFALAPRNQKTSITQFEDIKQKFWGGLHSPSSRSLIALTPAWCLSVSSEILFTRASLSRIAFWTRFWFSSYIRSDSALEFTLFSTHFCKIA